MMRPLMEMIERQPQTREQFSTLSGVGEKKLEAYSSYFLSILNQHASSNTESTSNNDTMEETLQLLRSGMNANDIAVHRKLKPTTIYSHLARSIEQGDIELKQAVDLSDKEIKLIQNAFLDFNNVEIKLKPVFEALDGEFDYGLLQCVRASVITSV